MQDNCDIPGDADVGDGDAGVLNDYDKKDKEKHFREIASLPGGADVGDGGARLPPLLVPHPCL